jgi:hypothetical protein
MFLAFGVGFLVMALMVCRLVLRDWSKLMASPFVARPWGLGFLGGSFLISAGLLFAAAALPHDSKALLLSIAGLWIARNVAMRLTMRRFDAALHQDD